MTYFAFRLLVALVPFVPARIGYQIAGWLADVLSVTARTSRATMKANLLVVVGSDADGRRLRRLNRLAFRNLAWNYYELARLPSIELDELRRAGALESLDRMIRDATKDSHTGAVIVFGHVGNMEVLCQVGVLLPELRLAVVVEHLTDERMFQLVRSLRCSQGLELVQADEPRRIVELLRSGSNLLIAGDFDSTGSGIVVDYFGRPAQMPCGAVKLALRTGAPLLVAEGWRERLDEPQRFRARLRGPFELTGSANRPEDVRAGVARLVRVLEEGVAARPEQWLAFRRVWQDAS